MPRRATHVTVGTLAGAGVAAYRARNQDLFIAALETIGGAIGGYAGGRLPDAIEPAVWSGHRQLAHSVAAGTTVAAAAYKLLGEWERSCRFYAEYYRNKKNDENITGLEKFLYSLLEILLCIACGALTGLSVGYLSHLVLDSRTPNSLPILQ